MRKIELYDTTLRDGSQSEVISFSLHDKVRLACRLDELGFDFVEGGYPASNPKDSEFFQSIPAHEIVNSRICAFGMTRRKNVLAAEDDGLKALLDSNAPVITLVGKASRFQAEEIIRVSAEDNLQMIRDSILFLVAHGRDVIFDAEHFFDGAKLDLEYSLQCLKTAEESGAIRAVLCDTNGGSLPEEVAELTRKAVDALQIPIGIHPHNDCGLAVANALAAVDAGASQVQGTVNGLGERCGNVDLVVVAANLALKKKYSVLRWDSLARLTDLARFVYELANMPPVSNQPYVGKSAFAHKGGMHVSGIARNSSSYEHVDPKLIGNERRILISELSGRSNIMALAEKYNIPREPKVMDAILRNVVQKESDGYQYEAAGGSFAILVNKAAGKFQPHFERVSYTVNVHTNSGGHIITEAIVKFKVGERTFHEVAEGDGPINALDAALRKGLEVVYPQLRTMQLLDYKVRVINAEAATAAVVRVIIESRDEKESWGTVGVSENVIEASWIALTDSLEYKLGKE